MVKMCKFIYEFLEVFLMIVSFCAKCRQKALKNPKNAKNGKNSSWLELFLTKNKKAIDKVAIANNSKKLVETLRDFGIIGEVVAVNVGPSVIQYELELSQGTKLSKLLGINREIALALAKKDVRIQAPIPGKNTVGIEMPNDNAQTVTLRETLEGLKRENKLKTKLTAGLGKDIMGNVQACYINKTPHLLVAGATGSLSLIHI